MSALGVPQHDVLLWDHVAPPCLPAVRGGTTALLLSTSHPCVSPLAAVLSAVPIGPWRGRAVQQCQSCGGAEEVAHEAAGSRCLRAESLPLIKPASALHFAFALQWQLCFHVISAKCSLKDGASLHSSVTSA